jgi:hypothetical protein
MSNHTSKATRQNQLRLVLAGIDKHLSNVTTITLGGTPVAVSDLKTRIQTDINASDASAQAKAAWLTDVQTERDSHTQVDPILRLFKLYVIAQFGDTQNATQTLADFGWTPRKSTATTVATKADALAKTKATREARRTMGSKQKAQVKGVVPTPPVSGTLPAESTATPTTPVPSAPVTSPAGTSVPAGGAGVAKSA